MMHNCAVKFLLPHENQNTWRYVKVPNESTQSHALPLPPYAAPFKRVMSLRDPLAKMSKSDPSDLSRINLTGVC